jgi:hypothetical protein
MTQRIMLTVALGACLVLGLATPARADLVIDNFDVANTNTILGSGTFLIRASPGTSSFNSGPHSTNDVIGGYRFASITTTARAGTLAVDFGDSNNLAFSLDSRSTGFATTTYNANGAGLGNVDLTQGGSNTFFLFVVVFSDAVGGKKLTVTINDGANVESHAVAIPSNINVDQNFLIPLNLWTVADLTSVDRIDLRIDSNAAGDLTLDFFGVTSPEPASLAMLGLGAVLSAGYGIRGYGIRRKLRRAI